MNEKCPKCGVTILTFENDPGEGSMADRCVKTDGLSCLARQLKEANEKIENRKKIIQALRGNKDDLDNCQFCGGTKGGVKGNCNVFSGIIVCDYCTPLVQRIIKDTIESVTKG